MSTLDPELASAARRRGIVATAARTGDITTVRQHLHDGNVTVRATAYAALARAGAARPEDGAAAAADPSPVVRRRAAELAGALPGVDHIALLADENHLVVEAAAFALGEIHAASEEPPIDDDPAPGGDETQARAVAELCRVARHHSDPLCRESAVAALGSIGDPNGLAAILDALSDRPTIRRRAVIALAPFEGNDVAAALERALGDRDWQVRQAAEDLLGIRPAADPGS